MKSYICLILTALPLLLTVTAFAQNSEAADDESFANRFRANYVTTFYSTDSNGFPSNDANVVLQTTDGFIWFGGFSGLIRYDGRKYTQWNAVSADNFTSSNVRSLYEEGGALWIGTNDRGLFSYKSGIFTVYDKAMGAPSNMIRCIAGRTDGMIFCGTPDGLFYIDGEKNIVTVEIDTAVHPFIISVAADLRGNIYAVLNTGELISYTADGRTVQYTFGSRFMVVYVSKTGRVFAGTQDGDVIITSFDGNNFTSPVIRKTPNLNISSFYEDSAGLIWLTSETGIGFLDANMDYHHMGNPSGFGMYSSIIEDYEKGYWITGTKGGIVKFSVSAFTDLNAMYNFPTGSANAVLIDNGKTYIGTDNNLYILDENGKPVFTDFSRRFNGRVRGIFRDSQGNIWFCTYTDMGAVRFNPQTGEYKNFTTAVGLASERTRSFVELPNGVIVIGTATGASFINGDSVISAGEAFGTSVQLDLPVITVLSLCTTADGTLYIGTDGSGVYAVNKNGSTHFMEEDGLTGGVILRLYTNSKTNGVWVSPSNGLCYIDENKKVRVIEKIPPYAIVDILQHNNELVLLTSSLIIRTDSNSLLDPSLPFTLNAVGRSSGLSASINANSRNFITSGSELYFCCDSGVKKYNFESTLSAVIPYAGITRIDIDGTEYSDFSEIIPLKSGAYRLTIEMSYLSFGLLDNAVMYYMLVGQDNEKHLMPKTGSLDVSYTNLRGGNYTFRVWTENSGGIIGSLIEVNLQKELNPLERPSVWFFIVIFSTALVALLFVFIYKYRVRMYKTKQHELETTVKERTRELAEQTAIAVQANRAKSEFLATMSHELRTPLNAIIGFSEIELRNRELSEGEQSSRNNIAHIYHSGSYLLEIINDILDIPKIESGNIDIVPAEYETAAMLSDVVNINMARLGSKPISFVLEIDADFPRMLTGDELRVKQILNNLLSNAAKYTQKGEIKLTIKSEQSDSGKLIISFNVRDTGIGIRAQDIGKLFHSYTRLDTGMNRGTEGTGLGLVIAKKLAEMMDGGITVESEYGKGSNFTAQIIQDIACAEGIGEETAAQLRNLSYIVIRNADDAAGSPTAAIKPVEYPRFDKKALVVDDVPANLELTVKMLSLYGVHADTAASGREAVENILGKHEPYDIIFMDHMMPEMDGIETTQILRENGYSGVIVALTASAMRGMKEFYLEEGFDDYLSKPINFNALGEIIKKQLADSEKKNEPAHSIAAEIASRRLDMLNHYCVSFENAVSYVKDKEIDTEYFDRFTALAETWILHEKDDVREHALALVEAGRRRDAQSIREKLRPFCDMLKEQEKETTEKNSEILHRLKKALLSGDSQKTETVLSELGAASFGQKSRKLYLRLYELMLTSETEKALEIIEGESND